MFETTTYQLYLLRFFFSTPKINAFLGDVLGVKKPIPKRHLIEKLGYVIPNIWKVGQGLRQCVKRNIHQKKLGFCKEK